MIGNVLKSLIKLVIFGVLAGVVLFSIGYPLLAWAGDGFRSESLALVLGMLVVLSPIFLFGFAGLVIYIWAR